MDLCGPLHLQVDFIYFNKKPASQFKGVCQWQDGLGDLWTAWIKGLCTIDFWFVLWV